MVLQRHLEVFDDIIDLYLQPVTSTNSQVLSHAPHPNAVAIAKGEDVAFLFAHPLELGDRLSALDVALHKFLNLSVWGKDEEAKLGCSNYCKKATSSKEELKGLKSKVRVVYRVRNVCTLLLVLAHSLVGLSSLKLHSENRH